MDVVIAGGPPADIAAAARRVLDGASTWRRDKPYPVPVELAFLGSGAAFSVERYNGAIVVDRRLLLDGGAPVLPHLHRLGIDPGGIEAIFLTHFHGDHFLGLPTFLLYRSFVDRRPLVFVGPEGVEERMSRLMEVSWGEEWRGLMANANLSFLEAGSGGAAAGVEFTTGRLKHGSLICTGYRLHVGGRVLAYAGDSEMTPELEEFVSGADLVITEATSPGTAPSHSTWEEATALRARHPDSTFLFNHIYAGTLEGAVSDLQVIEV